MSISYHAVPRRDRQLVSSVLEGRGSHVPIDGAAIRAALRERGFEGSDFGTLDWEADGGWVAIDVDRHHVDVTHGTSGGDEVMEQLMLAIEVLQRAGLHVWDPQRGDWFPS